MGLDMYLTKKTYVKNWAHTPEGKLVAISVMRGGEKHPGIDVEKINYIEEEVGYWRKANAIHKWFVDNVQKGEDDCGTYEVSMEQLKDLLDKCELVLSLGTKTGPCERGTTYAKGQITHHTEEGEVCADAERASRILPTVSGFFFGSTEYDDGYLADCRATVAILEPLLANLTEDDAVDFYYQASW